VPKPLTPAIVHILLALADEDRHGYGIMQEVVRLTEGRARMGPGTLYGTLKRLLSARLIEEAEERPDPQLDDERRRYYRLTSTGRRALESETGRVAALLAAARAKKVYP
jgi:DNA-binding PadR family transcriptional regulator